MKQKTTAIMGLMAAGALALGVRQAGAVNIDVYNGIGSDTTWSAANEYRLMEPVFVTNAATLTIEAGTVIRGKLNSNASLIISRGSKIRAMGTAQNPIVFTHENDNALPGKTPTAPWNQKNNGIGKTWGGVILLGRTYLATNVGEPGTPSPNGALELQIEGIESYGEISKYGGNNDDDNSGEMHYVSIRYGGYILGAANEINGLTLGGVGRGTQIDHIEVFQNADDCYEMFGGTVNLKYLVSWCGTDDGFDTDEGYRGKSQFFFRVQGPLSTINERSDKGTEQDGGMGDLSQPSSVPTIYNWTQVGLGKASGQKKNSSINMRDGTGARFYNTLWMDFGGACALIEGDYGDADGDTASKFGENYVNNAYYKHEAIGLDGVQSKKGEMKYNVWWKMGTNVAFACSPNSTLEAGVWGADGSDGNKAHYGYPLFTDASLQNYYLDEASYLSPVAQLTRSGTGVSLPDGKTYYPVQTINPLVQPAYQEQLMTYGRTPPNDGFYTPVGFIGAFGKDKNWAAGWTLASQLGMITGGTAGDYTGIVPQLRVNGGAIEVKLTADDYAGITGDVYILLDTPTGWQYFNYTAGTPGYSTMMPYDWTSVTLNGWLGSVAWSPITSVASLPSGTTTVYFGVDLKPGNGTIDFDRLVYATMNVVR